VKRVALTFDDGPSEWTPPLLELLAQHQARATFFVIGSVIDGREDVVRAAAEAGHELGNHTWSHPNLRLSDDERVHDELARTNERLAAVLGAPPTRFRAPHYEVDERVEAIGRRLGLAHTRGDVAPPDWHPNWNAKLTATFVLQQVRDGAVIGLHDGVPPGADDVRAGCETTVEAVATFLPLLVERGYAVVSAAMLLDT
jgi:peptidoglycan/xylan/chitin deacetylase (PgdA/CDA1 family)